MKTVFVSGASGGIGIAVCEKFLSEGYFVVAQYNGNLSSLKELAKKSGKDDYLYAVKSDFTNTEQTIKTVKEVTESFRHFDAVVTAAGVDSYGLFTDTSVEEWDRVFNINVKSTFLILKEIIPSMVKLKRGKIVTVSSVWGTVGASMESVYSASKWAIVGLTKSLSKELAPSNINVNCVSPGVIDTPMNDCFSVDEKQDLINRTPLNRFGKPSEIAELVFFLCSDKSDFVTGQNFVADGGFTL